MFTRQEITMNWPQTRVVTHNFFTLYALNINIKLHFDGSWVYLNIQVNKLDVSGDIMNSSQLFECCFSRITYLIMSPHHFLKGHSVKIEETGYGNKFSQSIYRLTTHKRCFHFQHFTFSTIFCCPLFSNVPLSQKVAAIDYEIIDSTFVVAKY